MLMSTSSLMHQAGFEKWTDSNIPTFNELISDGLENKWPPPLFQMDPKNENELLNKFSYLKDLALHRVVG